MTTKTTSVIGIIIFLALVTYFIYPQIRTFFAVDSCLDRGGKWDYQKGFCDTQVDSKETRTAIALEAHNIDFPCAVFIRPTLRKIEELRKENAEDYNTIVDDNEYYMAISGEYVDSVKLKRIELESERPITFRTAKGTAFKVPLDSIYWGIILFNGKTKPLKADMTFINSDYETYMKK